MPSNILLPLVPSLTGLLLKSWAGDAAAAVGQKLTEQATGWLGSAHKRRRAENRAREIAEAALDELEPLLTHELKGARPDVVSAELKTLLEGADAAGLVVEANLDARGIERALMAKRPIAEQRLDPEDEVLYRLVLARLSEILAAIAPELAGFDRALAKRDLEQGATMLGRLDRVAANVEELLPRIRAIEEAALRPRRTVEAFERSFLQAVLVEHDKVELLGLDDLDPQTREGKLTVAYLSLNISLDEGKGRRSVEFADLLGMIPFLGNRLLIEGPAGSGKTTLLRWAAITLAQRALGLDTAEVSRRLSSSWSPRFPKSTLALSSIFLNKEEFVKRQRDLHLSFSSNIEDCISKNVM